ncbi:MAG: SGNH/GDSL hydrolase family protein [Oceanipulchritudo sp.]|jgi:lysophospholipase L1-like esterase
MNKQATILFQGDSITDCGRPYDLEGKNYCESLGHGYVKILAGRIPVTFPENRWRIINRGLSGNKVTQLCGRWQVDTLNHRPDILSILIGVNDVWHGLPGDGKEYNGVNPVHFERTYRLLLDFTMETLPKVKLILGEPFLLKGTAWTGEFADGVAERQAIVKRIAKDFDAGFVRYQSAFDKALDDMRVDDLAPDGVHPTNLGNTVMADAWMQVFEELQSG